MRISDWSSDVCSSDLKELADAGITTIEDANRYIAETYLPAHNQRFRVEPAEPGSAFVPWAGGDLKEILCHQEDRVVARDNTVQFGKLVLQIPPGPDRKSTRLNSSH